MSVTTPISSKKLLRVRQCNQLPEIRQHVRPALLSKRVNHMRLSLLPKWQGSSYCRIALRGDCYDPAAPVRTCSDLNQSLFLQQFQVTRQGSPIHHGDLGETRHTDR